MSPPCDEGRLVARARAAPWFMAALAHVRALPSTLADIDVAYFDARDLSPERDAVLQRRLRASVPSLPCDPSVSGLESCGVRS
jgi:hypothetical protein